MDKKDEGGKGEEITRSGVSRDRIKKSTKMSRAISGNLVGVVPGNDHFLSRKISTSVGQRIILVLSPGLSLASQRGGFGKRQEPRVRFQ